MIAPVSIHGLVPLSSNPNRFSDMSLEFVCFSWFDGRSVPADDMVMINDMVRNCRFILLSLRHFSLRPSLDTFTCFVRLSLMFLQPGSEKPGGFSYVGFLTIQTRDFIHTVRGFCYGSLVFWMNKNVPDSLMWFKSGRNIMLVENPSSAMGKSLDVWDYNASWFPGVLRFPFCFLFPRTFILCLWLVWSVNMWRDWWWSFSW